MTTQPVEPLALRPAQAAKALGVSARTLWAWTRAGLVPCIRVGSGKRQITLYSAEQLREWLRGQSGALAAPPSDARVASDGLHGTDSASVGGTRLFATTLRTGLGGPMPGP